MVTSVDQCMQQGLMIPLISCRMVLMASSSQHIPDPWGSRCVWVAESQGRVEHNGRRRFGSWGSISEAFQDVPLPVLIPAVDGR